MIEINHLDYTYYTRLIASCQHVLYINQSLETGSHPSILLIFVST